MNPITCCKDCQKRQVGCHSKCVDYIFEKAAHEERKAEQYKEVLTQRRLDDELYNGISKNKRRKGK